MTQAASLALLGAALALPLGACHAPAGAAVTRCSTETQVLVNNPQRDCSLRVERFDGRAVASFAADAPRYYRHYEAEAEFAIERGRVLVSVYGSHDPVEFVVEPGRPWKGRIIARLNRQDQRFHVAMEPQNEAGGLQATIRHRNVVRSMVSPTEVLPQG